MAPTGGCSNPDHDMYPVYGVAPHECFWKKGAEFTPGQSTLLPQDQWPDNFVLEVEADEDPATITYPNACGVYYCPTCREGMPGFGSTAPWPSDGEGKPQALPTEPKEVLS